MVAHGRTAARLWTEVLGGEIGAVAGDVLVDEGEFDHWIASEIGYPDATTDNAAMLRFDFHPADEPDHPDAVAVTVIIVTVPRCVVRDAGVDGGGPTG